MAVNGIHEKPGLPSVYIVAAARTPVGMFLGYGLVALFDEIAKLILEKLIVELDSTATGSSCNKM
jgi:hypothetical protein